jgi:RNA polymerase sigma factor for flagellar operon FliA
MVELHIGLARSIAARVYRLMGGSVELDELVAHALAGLSEAAYRYRPDTATPFGLFAQYRIRGAIFDWLRSMGYLQRRRTRQLVAPRPGSDASGAAGAIDDDSAGPAPSGNEQPLPLPPRRRFLYLTAWEDDDEDGVLSVCSPEQPADAALAEKHTHSFLAKVLHRLPARERSFIVKHYYEDKTMTEAGAELGLSRYQSCRLHARVVAQLRAVLAAAGFRRFEDV